MKKNLIQLIGQFETREAKIYWINALKISNVYKGFLIVHFDLNQ